MDEDYTGTVRIMSILSSLYSIPVDDSYVKRAEKQQDQINSAINKNPQLKTIIEQLENHYEARTERHKEEGPRLSPEVERFLAEMDRRFREE
jgi:hypothetical protein